MIFAASGSPWSWIHEIPGVSDDTLLPAIFGFQGTGETHVLLAAWLSCFIVLSGALLARFGLERAKARNGIERYFADDRLSFRNGAEIFVGGIQSMMGDILERKDVRLFLVAIGGMFIYILCNNLIGVLPGGVPPTQSFSNNLAMSLVVLILFLFLQNWKSKDMHPL